jgi:DNA-binding response OmpR family regulator
MRILVVDDEQIIRNCLFDMLGAMGHEVRLADNGLSALSMIAESRPDAVMADLTMPEMDGLQLLEEIRKLPEPPPVIMLTGAELSNRKKAFELGAYDYFIKPPLLHELASRLSRLEESLNLKKAPPTIPVQDEGEQEISEEMALLRDNLRRFEQALSSGSRPENIAEARELQIKLTCILPAPEKKLAEPSQKLVAVLLTASILLSLPLAYYSLAKKQPPVAVAAVDAKLWEIWEAYDSNELRANERYHNKRIRTEGTVKNISTTSEGRIYLILATDVYNARGEFRFSDSRKQELLKLDNGSEVRIEGTVLGKSLLGGPLLDDCDLVQIIKGSAGE